MRTGLTKKQKTTVIYFDEHKLFPSLQRLRRDTA